MVLRILVRSIACGLVALSACDGRTDTPPSPSSSPFLTSTDGTPPSPTPPALPSNSPPTQGQPSGACVEGWVAPEPGAAAVERALRSVRRVAPFRGVPRIVDVRYFVGPESPPTDKGYLREVERWYIKLFAPRDPTYQGRFIVESRRFGDGLVAVAPYDTGGFRSPDWVGFQWNAADTEAKEYAGLPGTWRGIPYDFVRGGAGLEIPGLPAEVAGCLEGT